jgi:hypothetical protein
MKTIGLLGLLLGKEKSIPSSYLFLHSDPQSLFSKFAGKGKPINNKPPGTPDYRERVDFGEFIGIRKIILWM